MAQVIQSKDILPSLTQQATTTVSQPQDVGTILKSVNDIMQTGKSILEQAMAIKKMSSKEENNNLENAPRLKEPVNSEIVRETIKEVKITKPHDATKIRGMLLQIFTIEALKLPANILQSPLIEFVGEDLEQRSFLVKNENSEFTIKGDMILNIIAEQLAKNLDKMQEEQ